MTLLRTESFVPLTAAPVPAGNREFHAAVIHSDKPAKPLNSFQQSLSDATDAAGPGKKGCEPRLSVQRDGDLVTSIRIQCTCGQVMDIACRYDEPSQSS